jgi:LysM repeat protein
MSKSTPPAKEKKIVLEDTATPEVLDPAKSLEAYATQTALASLEGSEITPAAEGAESIKEEGTISPNDLEPSVEQTVQAALSENTQSELLPGEEQPLIGTMAVTSTVAAANIPTPTMGPLPQTYTIKQGEFPYCIARRFNVSITSLLNINGLGMNSPISAGQTLKIPQDGVPFDGQRSLLAHPTTYTVKAGDTIYSIACAVGDVDPIYLAQVNNLKPPYEVKAGTVLQVP